MKILFEEMKYTPSNNKFFCVMMNFSVYRFIIFKI